MATRVQIEGIGTVELDDSFKAKSQAEQQSIIEEIASQRSANGSDAPALGAGDPQGLQPSIVDRVVASPIGRFAHDTVLETARGANTLLNTVSPYLPVLGAAASVRKLTGQEAPDPFAPIETAYQGALSRNRNTPGYAQARARADAVENYGRDPSQPGSMSDQVLSPFMQTLAGTVGLVGGLDASNAAADAKAASMAQYSERSPILSGTANLLGGALAGPRGAADAVNAVASRASMLPRETSRAAEYVGGLMKASGRTPADLRAMSGNKPLTAAEAIGQPGKVGLAALGRRPGRTGDALQGMLDERAAGAAGRIMDDYAAASGINPHAAMGDIENLVSTGRQKAGPIYEKAYEAPPAVTDRLMQFANQPVVQQGMKEAIKSDAMRAVARGEKFDPNAYGITGFDNAGDPIISGVPTWRSWDAAKRGIDGIIEKQFSNPNMSRDRVSALVEMRRAMLKEIDALNPAFKEARAVSGDYLSAKSAFDKGQKIILDPNTTAAQFSKVIQGSSPAELEAMKGGVANKLFNLAQTGKLDPKVFNRPIVRQKLETLLGPDATHNLLSNVRIEAEMAQAGGRMRPGQLSPTQELNAAMAEQDGFGGLPAMALDAGLNVMQHGATAGTLKTLGRYVQKPLDYLRTPAMPLPVRDAAGEMLMMRPPALADLLDASLVPNGPGLTRGVGPVPFAAINAGGLLSPGAPAMPPSGGLLQMPRSH